MIKVQSVPNAEDAFGQYFSKSCYDNGIGTSQDRGKGFKFYSKAAEMDIQIHNTILHFCNSVNCQGYLEWISPDEIIFLDQLGAGGFGIVKKVRRGRGKILFWDKKNQKHERTGVTKVALKYLKDSQNINYINSNEFIAHHKRATCKYILECYGITKDVTTNGFVMILPFVEHEDLRVEQRYSYLEHDSSTNTWDLHPGNIVVLKTNPLKVVISDLEICPPANYASRSSKIHGILEYLAPENCKRAPQINSLIFLKAGIAFGAMEYDFDYFTTDHQKHEMGDGLYSPVQSGSRPEATVNLITFGQPRIGNDIFVYYTEDAL
ncbi:hypothetical protein G9A89_009922 [Geosiphon pyriformis]|nr:hypothetical protein G9A89_009922 [Geosiphon pyriformis]